MVLSEIEMANRLGLIKERHRFLKERGLVRGLWLENESGDKRFDIGMQKEYDGKSSKVNLFYETGER